MSSQDFVVLAAMRQLNYQHIPAKVMPADSQALECIRIAITDNITQRKLDLLEISRSLALLSECVENQECLVSEAHHLGLPDNYHHIDKIIGICRLPQLIQVGVCQNRISLNMATELQEVDASSGELLARFFMELKVNHNKQKEIFSHLKEISRREKRDIQNILMSEGISEVLADKDMDNLQKARTVRSKLRRRRFPNLSLAEETFQQDLRKLHLGSQISLLPPAYFEGTSLKLSLSFKSEKELKEQIEILNRTLTNPHLKKIFQPR